MVGIDWFLVVAVGLVYFGIGVIAFALFKLLVWIPMYGRRNNWVYDKRTWLLDNKPTEYEDYWSYNQMMQHIFTKDVEKMRGQYHKPWWLLWGRVI